MVIVPAFGVISEVLATSSRRSIFDTVDGLRSCRHWRGGIHCLRAPHVYLRHVAGSEVRHHGNHHAGSQIPTGIKIFNWLKTMHGGSLVYRTHTLWALGFLVTFTLGGISGCSSRQLPWTRTCMSYFVVAHFHYVLVGALSSVSSQPYTGTQDDWKNDGYAWAHYTSSLHSFPTTGFLANAQTRVWGMARGIIHISSARMISQTYHRRPQIGICSFQCPRFCSSCQFHHG